MLTRQEFLRSFAIAGAGLLIGAAPGPRQRVAAGEPPPLQRIALLSDPHVMAPGAPFAAAVHRKLARALDDFNRFAPDLCVINGDATDMGLPAEYNALRTILAGHGQGRPVYLNTGNHSFYDPAADDGEAIARFCRFTGVPLPYGSVIRPGVHLVLLSGERYKSAPRRTEWAWLSPAQLHWFDSVLARHPDLPTVVCLHQPLHDTVLQSEQPNAFAGVGESEALRRLLRRHRQVRLWCSGHTHIAAAAPHQVVQQDGVSFVALGSTFYLGRTIAAAAGPATGDLLASESRWLEVHPNELRLRVRDHRRGLWRDALELRVPLAGPALGLEKKKPAPP